METGEREKKREKDEMEKRGERKKKVKQKVRERASLTSGSQSQWVSLLSSPGS